MARTWNPALLYRWFRQRLAAHATVRAAMLWLTGRPSRPFARDLMGRRLSSGEIGRLGEWIALRWLRAEGRKVLARNFKAVTRGEVDIIARHGAVLTFVEVKTRTRVDWQRPADAVGPEKQQLIIRGAQGWLKELHPLEVPFRFDVVEVVLQEGQPPQVGVIEDAFQMPDNHVAGR